MQYSKTAISVSLVIFLLGALLLLGALPVSRAVPAVVTSINAQDYEPARTEYGHPDLRGVWNFSTPTPLERPERFGEREFLNAEEIAEQVKRRQASSIANQEREANASSTIMNTRNARSTGAVNSFWMELTGLQENPRTSVIIHPSNGRLPEVQPGVQIQLGDQNGVREIPGERPVRYTHGGIARNGPEDRGLSERCIVFNNGPPLFSGPYNNNLQIFQNRDHVVILTEMGFDARMIPLDGRSHVDENISQWSGDSRGYFEGDTLVVTSRNFTHKLGSLSLRDRAYGSAEQRLLIERFTPTGSGMMEYEFTIEDRATFTDTIVGVIPMTQTNSQIYEYACHAGNYAIGNILKGARAEDGEL
jgi:hypothetical protein